MSQDTPLRRICGLWNEKITQAAEFKKRVFGDDADECMRFFNGPHDFMFEDGFARGSRGFKYAPGSAETGLPYPSFAMTVNKVAELVQIFGPVLYFKNPTRQVRPRKKWVPPMNLVVPPGFDPAAVQQQAAANPAALGQLQAALQQHLMALQQYQALVNEATLGNDVDRARAELMELYLNYTPNETGLKDQMRLGIDEALIKGRGVWWTELYTPPGADYRVSASWYETVDGLLVDPDLENLYDAKWVARMCCHPVWQVEQEYGLEPGSLRGSLESTSRQAAVETDNFPGGIWARKRGASNDLIRYWKVYSKMGIGARLAGGDDNLRQTFDQFGDNCFLVIAKDIPYPLNLPPQLVEKVSAGGDEQAAQELLGRLDWPVPFWAESDKQNTWPFTELDFHTVPRSPWPMSHLKPAMGEQKFLNWAYSFLAGKVRNTCRDFVAVLKSAGEDLKTAILKGEDLTLVEIEAQHKTISEVVQFLQHPPVNGDIFKVIQAVEHNFERRTGLSELMYGESARQMRSAEEANVKKGMITVRPDDMAERVESVATRLARKEAILARWLLKPEDVAPILGPRGAQWWGQLVSGTDLHQIVRELEYRVEAGSSKKPNKDADVQNTSEGVQVVLPVLDKYASATGQLGPLNAFLQDWAKARDFDASQYVLQPPPPPPAPPPGAQGPPGPAGGPPPNHQPPPGRA